MILRTFKGMYPRLDPRLLPEDAAQTAKNLWLDRGVLRPILQSEVVDGVPAFSTSVKSIYRWAVSSTVSYWFQWSDDVDVVRAPLVNDTSRRIIWTGHDYPRYTSTTIAGSFSSPGLPVSRRLGIPAPETAPLVSSHPITIHIDRITVALSEETADQVESRILRGQSISVEMEGGTEVPLGEISGIHRIEDVIRIEYPTTDAFDWTASATSWTLSFPGPATGLDPVTIELATQASNTAIELSLLSEGEFFVNRNVEIESNSLQAETHSWSYTYVSDLGEEGPQSPPSRLVTRGFDVEGQIQSAVISGLPTGLPAELGDRGVNRKRIYRTATGITGISTWHFLAEVSLSTAEYTDETQTAELGDEIVSSLWDPPPASLAGIIALPNGVLAGFSGRYVYFSEPFQPHAWPTDYIQALEYDVVGLGNYGATIIAATTGRPYLISGGRPDQMQATQMELDEACVGKRTIVSHESGGIVFAGPDGLVQVGPGGQSLVTRNIFARQDWQALDPGDIRAVNYDGAWIGWNDEKGIAITPQGVVEIDDAGVKVVWHDRETDQVYLIDSESRLREWSNRTGDGSRRTMDWKSRRYVDMAHAYSFGQVIADGYPVRLRIYGDGVEVLDKSVVSSTPFRLALKPHSEWEVQVEGTSIAVKEIRLGATRDMLGV